MVSSNPSIANILLVDDTPDNLRLLAKILESHDYLVRKSLSGKMALQAIFRDPPDLILLDINMPEMSGYEVCQQLRASATTQHIPIIFISALDHVSDKVYAFEVGGQDYITKPFHEMEVLARIKNQLLIRQQQKEILEQQALVIQKNEKLHQEIEERQRVEAEVRRLNADLEQRVEARTRELQQALNLKLALQRISDQVRDSLDQNQILQTAVETLAQVLNVHCCDAALYSADHATSTIRYQWLQPGLAVTQGQTLYMADFPELYEQLQERLCFAFCQIQPTAIRHHSAILACPIFDHQVDQSGILGDLWLFREVYASFSAMEVHLVQQAANQCAIALRQARLYEAAQSQVRELERLNQLKDDFLSTISHELRSPVASMKMVLKLLMNLTDQGQNFVDMMEHSMEHRQKAVQYLTVLQEECDRELALVEDLLHLQHIEAGTYDNQPTPVFLQDFIPYLLEPFEARAHNQQQRLNVTIAPDLPTLNLDPLSLTRVVTELLSNACKYTPAGGTISVMARASAQNEGTEPIKLRLSVTNTGVEIMPTELPRIFDKFYRIPNNDPWKHGGTGLGLTLVKKLVEQMQGHIQVESNPDQTRFTVLLAMDQG
ncbi:MULTISPECIES: response regulator [unclassified Leptolyngbya]|uniref:hybrid sensor histidine kinase/response regulator n=1 Tax=unclassified Leptolyngbya TaxID=2650499 RepID=UPI001689D3C4|nr:MULTISPECIES: response regulator [unclassified Leptolyngbya]MBD1913970.1 response regulator [Leptolyngbya sp. FACHB-8]MBD2155937.1 response regulator [Leptolyngbya sp. FACHB-16]